MTNKEYVEQLKMWASLPTKYCNKPGYNLGYYNGSEWQFDCWNLVKSILNGVQPINKVGYKVSSLKVTGDINGKQILDKCTVKSKNFADLKIPGSYLYMPGHAGSYIGDTVIDGKTYNVVECTGSWTKNVLYSYVDARGYRYKYKGATTKNGYWTDWGLMCWVQYDETYKPEVIKNYIYKGVDYKYVFDTDYYKKRYSDCRNQYGDNDNLYFEHFIRFGMKEKRQGNDKFNVLAYMNFNSDLVKEYKQNIPLYYEHYCRFGHSENRKTLY